MEGNYGLLPADVLLEIFSYFSYSDLVKFQFVCRWWQRVSREKYLWRNIEYKPGRTDNIKEIVANLKESPELRALDLRCVHHSTVAKELVEELVNGCPKLEKLTVIWDWLYDNIHSVMKKIHILILDVKQEYFDSFGNQVNFEYLHKYFPNVEYLDCNLHLLRECDLQVYLKKKRRSLHTVGFRCETHGIKCVLPYLSVCTTLKSLTLFSLCDQVGRLPAQSVKRLKQISSLTLQDSGWYNVNDFLPMFTYFPNLVVLHFNKCDICEEQALLEVAKNCPLVKKLTLSSLGIMDHNLEYVSSFKELTFLCLKNNRYITDACVSYLQAISELTHLDILDCERLTPQCLLVLRSFDKLQILKFDLQNHDPPADFGAAHVNNPDLIIMFYKCKDTSVLDCLRRQRLRISLLK